MLNFFVTLLSYAFEGVPNGTFAVIAYGYNGDFQLDARSMGYWVNGLLGQWVIGLLGQWVHWVFRLLDSEIICLRICVWKK